MAALRTAVFLDICEKPEGCPNTHTPARCGLKFVLRSRSFCISVDSSRRDKRIAECLKPVANANQNQLLKNCSWPMTYEYLIIEDSVDIFDQWIVTSAECRSNDVLRGHEHFLSNNFLLGWTMCFKPPTMRLSLWLKSTNTQHDLFKWGYGLDLRSNFLVGFPCHVT